MSFSTEIIKSVSDFRVLIDIDSVDGLYDGRFSFQEFIPIGATDLYEGRLLSAPDISVSRDSAYFGILVYSSSGINLANNDGAFDTIMEDYKLIGASAKVYIGFKDLNISEYVLLYSGYIERVNINETEATFTIADLRKRLTVQNDTDVDDEDAVTAIEKVLVANYPITASSAYFNMTAWSAAKSIAKNVFRKHPNQDTVAAAIEDFVSSTVGFFYITSDGKYSYHMVDTSATSQTIISRHDILNGPAIQYSEDGIIGKVSVESPTWEGLAAGLIQASMFSPYMSNKSCITMLNSTGTCLIGCTDLLQAHIFKTTDRYTWTTAQSITYTTGQSIVQFLDLGAGEAWLFLTDDYVRTWNYGNNFYHYIAGPNFNFVGGASDRVGNALVARNYSTSWSRFYKIVNYATAPSAYHCSFNSCIQAIGYASAPVPTYFAAGTDVWYDGVNLPSTVSIYKSTDWGSSWTLLESVPYPYSTGYTKVNSVVAETSDRVIYTFNYYREYNHGLARYTKNGGGSWMDIFSVGNPSTNEVFYNGFVDFNGDFILNRYYTKHKKDAILSSQTLIDSYDPICDDPVSRLGFPFYNWYNSTVYFIDIGPEPDYNYSVMATSRDENNRWGYDNSHSASTLALYGTSPLKTFNTVLKYTTDAMSISSTFLDYFKDMHGTTSITVPIRYYWIEVGDNVDVEIWRETTSFLGTKRCEVLGKAYDLKEATIKFELRII